MRKFCAASLVLLSLLVLGGCASQKVLAEFDIPKAGRLITLPVQVAGKEYQFLMDTGATYCLFDETFRSSLGEPVKTREFMTPGQPVRLALYHSPEAFLGNISLKDGNPVMCFDMKMIRQVSGLDIYGIIGMNILGRYVVRIDFDLGRLALLEPKGVAHPEWGRHVPIARSNLGLPTVKGKLLGGTEETFTLDTGCSSAGSLRKKLFERLVNEHDLKTSESLFEYMSGTMRESVARAPEVSVGDMGCENLIFIKSKMSGLGLGWLSRFRVTFDFPCRRLYLAKGNGFDRPDEANMSGLYFLYVDGQVLVHSVDKNSPAGNAGVRPRDVIQEINGLPAGDLFLQARGPLLRAGDKKKVTLTILRGGKDKTVTFELKKRI